MSCCIIYYYYNNEFAYYIEHDDITDQLKFIDIRELNKPEHKFHHFGLFEDYEKTHEGLKRFKKDMIQWTDKEIKTVGIKTKTKKYCNLDYCNKYLSHNHAVYLFWKGKTDIQTLNSIEPVSKDEFFISERCVNSGLISINPGYINKPTEMYGYDYSRYYTNLLMRMKIPIKQGTKNVFQDVAFGKLQFGIYRVNILTNNCAFTNMFNFSAENHYTSSTLNYLWTKKEKYNLDFELLEPDDKYNYNALVYEEKDLVLGKKLFGDWSKELEQLREKFPKNKLVKYLMSTLWGELTSFKTVYINNPEEYDITKRSSPKESEYKIMKHMDDGYYKSIKTDDAYNHPLARIKSFLTAFGRLTIMKLIESNNLEENFIRVHTDGIVLSKSFDFSKVGLDYYPKPEDKTTGYIKYHNKLFGFHVCKNCDQEFKFRDYQCHVC
jgi:hypothetical protein